MPLSHNFLDDHGHLLFAWIAADGADVIAGFTEECGGINKLDSFQQSTKTRVGVELVIRNHFRRIYPGERMLQCILEQTRGTNRKGGGYLLDECAKIPDQFD